MDATVGSAMDAPICATENQTKSAGALSSTNSAVSLGLTSLDFGMAYMPLICSTRPGGTKPRAFHLDAAWWLTPTALANWLMLVALEDRLTDSCVRVDLTRLREGLGDDGFGGCLGH